MAKNISSRNLKKKKGKKKNNRLRKIIVVVVLILILLAIIWGIKSLIGMIFKKNVEPKLIIGSEIINLKQDLIIDKNENIYLSKDDIANIYDKNIYYNPTDDSLITTYNKHIALLEKDKSTMLVNDTVIQLKGKMKKEKGNVYLPYSDMTNIYDFEYIYNEESKAVVVDSTNKEKKEAVVLRKTKLKEKTGMLSKKIENIDKGDKVLVVSQEGKYAKVRTCLGNIGYIKTDRLSKVKVLRENFEDEKIENLKVLDDYKTVSDKYENLESSTNTRIVTPNLFSIKTIEKENVSEDVESKVEFKLEQIISLKSDKYEKYLDWANNNNIGICASINLEGSMNKLCQDYVTRTCLINNIYSQLIEQKINMVNIDFKEIDDIEGFYRFIIELTPRFKEAGIKVLVTYNEGMNKERLNTIVDYVL